MISLVISEQNECYFMLELMESVAYIQNLSNLPYIHITYISFSTIQSLMIEQLNISFQQMITMLREDNLYKQILLQAQKNYSVKVLKLQTFSPSQVFQLIKRLTEKGQTVKLKDLSLQKNQFQLSWGLNEFKLFSWISVCYAFLIKKQLQNLNSKDFLFLQQLFPRKSLQFLQYHIKSLISQHRVNIKKWEEEQITLLKQLIQEEKDKLQWSQVSFNMFIQSKGKYHRTPQKCREHWINHLDPMVNRSKWTVLQDLQLFKAIREFGSKWSYISKIFKGVRTEHMVKNRYNSIFRRYQNKSQRATPKKIIQKIIDDLQKKTVQLEQRKLKQLCLSKKVTSLSQQLSQKDFLQVSLDQLCVSSNNQNQFEQSEVVQYMGDDSNKCLNLHQIMFSETAIGIEMPSPSPTPLEMMQIELYVQGYKTREDEDLYALFQ